MNPAVTFEPLTAVRWQAFGKVARPASMQPVMRLELRRNQNVSFAPTPARM